MSRDQLPVHKLAHWWWDTRCLKSYLVQCLDGSNWISVTRVEACTVEGDGHAACPGHAQGLHRDARMQSLVGGACGNTGECQQRRKSCCRRHSNGSCRGGDVEPRAWHCNGFRKLQMGHTNLYEIHRSHLLRTYELPLFTTLWVLN